MNIAYFLLPKSRIAYLYDDFTFRQGLEKMRNRGYTAIPVITRDGRYVGTVSEGDFLWRLLDTDDPSMKKAEELALKMAGMLSLVAKIFAPLVWLLTASTNFWLRRFGIDPEEEEEIAQTYTGFLTLEPHLVLFDSLQSLETTDAKNIIRENKYKNGAEGYAAQYHALCDILAKF